ncbi:MAG: class I poly(R)-hydroxyalkanoic acid synthase [Rhodospirillaceae bacterium]|nr:MAG: class I poly(R)-hydroxyalkanoic acid synthase [Rhodospirillaceae bacterium]
MADQASTQTLPPSDAGASDPGKSAEEWNKIVAEIGERSQRILGEFLSKAAQDPSKAINASMSDPASIGGAFLELTAKMWANPQKLMESQLSLWNDYMELWRATALRLAGTEASPVIEPEASDKRFKDDAWRQNEIFDYIKQSYLLASRWLQSTVNGVDGLDPHTQRKVDFYTRQFVDAMAPTNFALTNPEVLRTTVATKGENLVKGLEHLLEDMEKGGGRLRISMTDEKAFKVGVNVATTPGKVVAQNRMMQLIQYEATTPEVKETPILILPPWINKYYILDLRPKNSLVKWLTDQGYTTFVVSWINPDESMADITFDDYMLEGAIAAKNFVMTATAAKKVHMVGYCIGGTLLAATLAYLKAKGDNSVATATYFVTMTDFKEAGDLAVFVDEAQIVSIEKKMAEKGYLDAAEMATTFNLLRANDLIWSFVVNNYLLGKEPFPFDLLYWNADSTRMPRVMHSFYLRNMYLDNKLMKPGGITLGGVPIDLGTIKCPTYMVSCKEDHIAPWVSTFAATRLFGGPVRFVLSGSGHIAGVVNPPSANKYGYWTNDAQGLSADTWISGAAAHPGSWWTDWDAWLAPQSGKTVPARVPGDSKLKVLGDAPGSYVMVRAT